jgi:glycosyltransferase involved in cell wall biosynthesis
MKIAILANTAWYIHNFRTNLILALQESGNEVIACSPADEYAKRLPCMHVGFSLDKSGENPVKDILAFAGILRILALLKPDLVLNFTPKVNIYASFAARILSVPVVSNIAGLGKIFANKNRLKNLVLLLYKLSQKRVYRVFFQNNEDRQLFLDNRIVRSERAIRIPGSGVDLERFHPHWSPAVRVKFLFASRLLVEKGICEFIEAARRIGNDHASFLVAGFVDEKHPSGITSEEIAEWEREGIIEFLGYTDDIVEFIKKADCVVLPSYYREGVPRILLEAAAMAKPIITTDTPGCRDAVDDCVSGFLCRPRDPEDLKEKMLEMSALSGDERRLMGERGRKKMLDRFDEKKIISAYLDAIAQIEDERSAALRPSSANKASGKKIAVVQFYFYPDLSAVSQMIYDLLLYADKNGGNRFTVFSSSSSYNGIKLDTGIKKLGSNLEIKRIKTPGLGRRNFLTRILDYSSYYVCIFFYFLFSFRWDAVVCLTSPPFIGFVVALATFFKKIPLVYYIQDLYPELLFDLNYVNAPWLIRKLRFFNRIAFRKSARIIVIGDSMAKKIIRNYGVSERKLEVINNWAIDIDREPGKNGGFTILYSGNMGLAHDFTLLANFLRAIKTLGLDVDNCYEAQSIKIA